MVVGSLKRSRERGSLLSLLSTASQVRGRWSLTFSLYSVPIRLAGNKLHGASATCAMAAPCSLSFVLSSFTLCWIPTAAVFSASCFQPPGALLHRDKDPERVACFLQTHNTGFPQSENASQVEGERERERQNPSEENI